MKDSILIFLQQLNVKSNNFSKYDVLFPSNILKNTLQTNYRTGNEYVDTILRDKAYEVQHFNIYLAAVGAITVNLDIPETDVALVVFNLIRIAQMELDSIKSLQTKKIKIKFDSDSTDGLRINLSYSNLIEDRHNIEIPVLNSKILSLIKNLRGEINTKSSDEMIFLEVFFAKKV